MFFTHLLVEALARERELELERGERRAHLRNAGVPSFHSARQRRSIERVYDKEGL